MSIDESADRMDREVPKHSGDTGVVDEHLRSANPRFGREREVWLSSAQVPQGDALRYDVEVDVSNENTSHAQLALLTGPGKNVLEVGPATGYLTKVLREAGCSVTGVEIDPVAARKAEPFCDRVIVGDIEALDFADTFGDERFDVVIYGDVLEHLVDPVGVLVRTREILGPDGVVLASIPNVTHGSIRLAVLTGRFSYTDVGLLDRTHLRFFDRAAVISLFEAGGFSVEEWRDTTIDPFATELELSEAEFPPHLVDMVRRAPDALIYQFVVLARPAGSAGESPFPAQGDVKERALAPLWRLEDHVRNLEISARNQEASIERLMHQEKKLDDIVRARDRQLAELTTELESAIRQREAETEGLRRQFEQTLGQRMKRGLRRFVDRIAPWGTRRRSLILTPARLLKVGRTQGWGTFFARLAKVWEWIPRMFGRAYPNVDRLSPSQLYTLWLELTMLAPKRVRQARRDARHLTYQPRVSIVMPVYNTDPRWLRGALVSVLGQVYANWELCVVDDGSRDPATLEVLREYERRDPRVRVRYSETNGGIVAASNIGLAMATGEFVGFLDHDDELKKTAVYEVVRLLNEDPSLDFVYSDEDKRGEDGRLVDPFFKPDWSPDLLMSVNYVTHFAVYRKEVVDRVGGLRKGFEGSQDYDLALRITESTHRIGHAPVPAYTWRMISGSAAQKVDAKPYALTAARKALADAIQRRGYGGRVEAGLIEGRYRVRYDIKGEPKLTIIIPTRDKATMLRRCIDSIKKRSTYRNYEIMVVDNESRERATREYLRSFDGRVVEYPHPFNYAKMMNFAVREAGETPFVLLLNNDTEVISEGWIEALLEHGQRPEVAAAGARLLYPNGTPQHEGIIMGFPGVTAGNVDFNGYDGMGETIRDCSAVTGACMLMRTDLYLELGGLEEQLGVAFNDVDLCLRAREKGFEIVYTPYALLYHHESATRGKLHPDEDEQFFRARWGEPGEYRDPYYSPNLDIRRPFQLDLPAEMRSRP